VHELRESLSKDDSLPENADAEKHASSLEKSDTHEQV
jgi:hypothetical protein